VGRDRPSHARSRGRDLLIRALYQWQINETTEAALLTQLESDGELAEIDQAHFRRLLRTALTETPALDAIIAAHAARSFDQLDEISRSVLLAGLAELKECGDVPTKVVINEAVELAKRYGAADSYKFVNALLDKAARELR
jgi:transcription antitermination protein NusB